MDTRGQALGGHPLSVGYQPAPPMIAPAEPAPTVGGEIEQNAKRNEVLHATIETLEKRLCSVLRPTGPSTEGNAGQAPLPWSQVVCQLRHAGYETETAIARLQDILQRLDI